MKRVITYGTFDLFHIGRLDLLKRAKALGNYLIVAVSSDDFNLRKKDKVCQIKNVDRMEIVRAICYVDKVILEENWEQEKLDVQKYDVDVFVMGDGWEGKSDSLKEYCEAVYPPRTEGISSTMVRSELKQRQ